MFACFRKPCVNLTNNQKARFNNFKKRYGYGITPNQIYNQLKREKEHSYTPKEKSLVHHFMKTQNMTAIQAHNKILNLRKPVVAVFGNAGRAYTHNH
jgi:hypothetical protein